MVKNIISMVTTIFIISILFIGATKSLPIHNASPIAGPMLDAMAVASAKGIGEFKLMNGKKKSDKYGKFDFGGPRMTKFVLVEQKREENE